jgi:hypothetical protein
MDRSGTENLGLIARLMYGYILSNTNVLTAAETSFVLIAGLIPQDVSFTQASFYMLMFLGEPTAEGPFKECLKQRCHSRRGQSCQGSRNKICEASGMKKIGESVPAGWGWRGDVANL